MKKNPLLNQLLFLHLPLLLGILLLSVNVGRAQVYDGGTTLRSQSDVDAFINYTSVTEYLRIDDQHLDPDSPDRIKNLNGLSNLTSIGGNLLFFFTDSLHDVDGLNNLTSIGGFLSIRFTGIHNLNGFSNLTSVNGIWLDANSWLTDISGLSGITSLDTLWITWNYYLFSLNGLSNISGPVKDLAVFRNRVTSLDQLSGITSVEDTIIIAYESNLPNLDGLSNISFVGGDLSVFENRNLKNYCGLYNLFSTDGLEGNFISYNNLFDLTKEQIIACGPCSGLSEPIANAGIDKTEIVGTVVQLNGNESFDPGGGVLTYNWFRTGGIPFGSNVQLSDPNVVSPTFIPDLPGFYNYQLRVNNGCAASNVDTVTITVITVEEALNDATETVENLPLNDGNKNALKSKLQNALAKYNSGDYNAAKNILFAFLNQLNQFVTDGLISSAEAQPLIDYANQIIDAINFSLPKTENDDSKQLPEDFVLNQNYPNPFNPSTTISYQLPVASHVSLKVYDLLGNEVVSLINEFKGAGSYSVNFDAAGLSSGTYFYRLNTGSFTETKKLLLMK